MSQDESPQIVIVGSGGHAREIFVLICTINSRFENLLSVVGLLADYPVDKSTYERIGLHVIGNSDDAFKIDARFIIGIGDPHVRQAMDTRFRTAGLLPASPIIHPEAWVGADVELGAGSVVFPGARITTNVRVGNHVHINVNSSVSHDVKLGDFVTVGPHAAICGSVVCGDNVNIGANASVIPGIRIGQGAIVGAGAVVIEDVPEYSTVVGVPARLVHPTGAPNRLNLENKP